MSVVDGGWGWGGVVDGGSGVGWSGLVRFSGGGYARGVTLGVLR